jgi:cyclopropane fatty-acyl-phospholipid synthase-like methyltransferase
VREQERLHLDPDYGSGSWRHAYLVAGILKVERCGSWLDYGCGKGTLLASLRQFCNEEIIGANEWDPGRVGKRDEVVWLRKPFDLVTCIDVMEHIEPKSMNDVMDHIHAVTSKLLFLDIALKFDKHRKLTDGRNSHQIVEEEPWWKAKFIRKGFKIRQEWPSHLRAWVALLEKK